VWMLCLVAKKVEENVCVLCFGAKKVGEVDMGHMAKLLLVILQNAYKTKMIVIGATSNTYFTKFIIIIIIFLKVDTSSYQFIRLNIVEFIKALTILFFFFFFFVNQGPFL
jgi:hypothetical protein